VIKPKLYIAGSTPEIENAVREIKSTLDEITKGQCTFEICDMLENVSEAAEDDIIVTPTIVKHYPPPKQKIVGDIRAKEKILHLLLDRIEYKYDS